MYDRTAAAASAVVIRRYSTSFSVACRLLPRPERDRISAVYALVRLADEIVDGPVGVHDRVRAGLMLDHLQHDTTDALREGNSANLVVHAFAVTARPCGIDETLVAPFFDSMRTDLTTRVHDRASFDRYVYGSAEVVGLMCLRVFLGPGADPATYDALAPGARRLGAAFQKVNFLRDLGEDHEVRGRCYFPGLDPARLTEADKHHLLDDIDRDLAVAAEAAARLPPSCQRAVGMAEHLFRELAERLRETPVDTLRTTRVRVPSVVKARILVTVLAPRPSFVPRRRTRGPVPGAGA